MFALFTKENTLGKTKDLLLKSTKTQGLARVSGIEMVSMTEVVSRPSTVVETQVFPVSVSDVEHDAQVFLLSVSILNMMS